MGNSATVKDLEEAWDKLRLEEEDEGGMEVTAEELRQPEKERADLRFCLIGRFLTDKQINFIAKKNTLALLWEPRKGITITEVDAGRYLFQFQG